MQHIELLNTIKNYHTSSSPRGPIFAKGNISLFNLISEDFLDFFQTLSLKEKQHIFSCLTPELQFFAHLRLLGEEEQHTISLTTEMSQAFHQTFYDVISRDNSLLTLLAHHTKKYCLQTVTHKAELENQPDSKHPTFIGLEKKVIEKGISFWLPLSWQRETLKQTYLSILFLSDHIPLSELATCLEHCLDEGFNPNLCLTVDYYHLEKPWLFWVIEQALESHQDIDKVMERLHEFPQPIKQQCLTNAFVYALENFKVSVGEILLRHGESPNTMMSDGQSALMWMLEQEQMELGEISNDFCEVLIKYGAQLNFPTLVGLYPLFEAFYSERFGLVKAMLEMGASVHIRSTAGDTPLIVAVKKEALQLCRYILARGASANDANHLGETALFYAIKSQLPEEEILKFCALLIQFGADLNYLNHAKQTPIDLAEELALNQVTDYLKACLAKKRRAAETTAASAKTEKVGSSKRASFSQEKRSLCKKLKTTLPLCDLSATSPTQISEETSSNSKR